MERADALRQLTQGGLTADIGAFITSPERRAQAKMEYEADWAAWKDLERRIHKQFGDERTRLWHHMKDAEAAMSDYQFRATRQISVGDEIVAKGDTWEELFSQLPEKPVRRRTSPPRTKTPLASSPSTQIPPRIKPVPRTREQAAKRGSRQ